MPIDATVEAVNNMMHCKASKKKKSTLLSSVSYIYIYIRTRRLRNAVSPNDWYSEYRGIPAHNETATPYSSIADKYYVTRCQLVKYFFVDNRRHSSRHRSSISSIDVGTPVMDRVRSGSGHWKFHWDRHVFRQITSFIFFIGWRHITFVYSDSIHFDFRKFF